MPVSDERAAPTWPKWPKLRPGHDERMTENGAHGPIHQSRQAPSKGASNVSDSRPLTTSRVDPTSCREHSDVHKRSASNAEGEISPYQPRPPSLPKLPKSNTISVSVEETVRTRRLRNSQESLSDPVETGSSTDSLSEDQAAPDPGGFVPIRSDRDSMTRPRSAVATGSPVSRDRGRSLSEYETRPRSQQSDPTDHRARPAKARLSPVRPTGTLPALEESFASATLRAAKSIDRDCVDYAVLAGEKLGERLPRNLSDSRLLDNMGSDGASVNSMRSTYSVLSPIRPQDVRNRYSQQWHVTTDGGDVIPRLEGSFVRLPLSSVREKHFEEQYVSRGLKILDRIRELLERESRRTGTAYSLSIVSSIHCKPRCIDCAFWLELMSTSGAGFSIRSECWSHTDGLLISFFPSCVGSAHIWKRTWKGGSEERD